MTLSKSDGSSSLMLEHPAARTLVDAARALLDGALPEGAREIRRGVQVFRRGPGVMEATGFIAWKLRSKPAALCAGDGQRSGRRESRAEALIAKLEATRPS